MKLRYAATGEGDRQKRRNKHLWNAYALIVIFSFHWRQHSPNLAHAIATSVSMYSSVAKMQKKCRNKKHKLSNVQSEKREPSSPQDFCRSLFYTRRKMCPVGKGLTVKSRQEYKVIGAHCRERERRHGSKKSGSFSTKMVFVGIFQ